MHCFLITPGDASQIDLLIQKGNYQKIDFEVKTIEDCRRLTHFSSLSQQKPTALVISDFHLASTEAQNAFLKSLEEPQDNIIYILTAPSEQSILPTVVSRCHIIRTNSKNKIDLTEQKTFSDQSIGEKFLVVSKIKKREDALEFVSKLLEYLHQKLLTDSSVLAQTQNSYQTLKALQANGNVNLQLTNFVSKYI